MTKQEWLEAKYTTIGATDASVILGVNPYKTVYELYAGKAKLVPADETISTKPAVMRGVLLEPIIRNLFDATIKPVVHEEYRQITMPGYDYITCTPDGIVGTYEEPEAMLEIKNRQPLGLAKEFVCIVLLYSMPTPTNVHSIGKTIVSVCNAFLALRVLLDLIISRCMANLGKHLPHTVYVFFNIYPDKELHAEMLRRYCIF